MVLQGMVDDCAAVMGYGPGGFPAEVVEETGSEELVRKMIKLRG